MQGVSRKQIESSPMNWFAGILIPITHKRTLRNFSIIVSVFVDKKSCEIDRQHENFLNQLFTPVFINSFIFAKNSIKLFLNTETQTFKIFC